MSSNRKAMKILIKRWRSNPILFAKEALGFIPDEWQKGTLEDIRDNPLVAVRSGQGVGKTSVEAVVILWFLVCFTNAKVICTAPTKQQLIDVLWAEVAKWLNSSRIKNLLKWTKTKINMVGSEDRWFATARTATKPENMQGFHEDNMLFVVDEGSGISDLIMEAILGTLSGVNNKLLMMGNPTKTNGIFYDAFHKDRGDWKTRKVSSLDSTRTNKKNIERLIRRYGKDSDVVRVRVFGDFPRGEPNAYITLSEVETAMSRELPEGYEKLYGTMQIPEEAEIKIGVDVARYGDDETVICIALGDVVLPLKISSKQGLMETTGHVMQHVRWLIETYWRRVTIKIDDTGLGGGVTDRLIEIIQQEGLPVTVKPINFAQKGNKKFKGVISLMYGNLKEEKLDTLILPDDDELVAQLSSRHYTIRSDGRIEIESKKDMKARKLPSPDRAEALAMTFYEPPTIQVGGFEGGL